MCIGLSETRDIATIAGAAFTGIAAVVAAWQLLVANRMRKLQALSTVFATLASEDARTDRRVLFSLYQGEPKELTIADLQAIFEGKDIDLKPVTEDQLLRVEKVCVAFDRIGSLVQLGLVPIEQLLESHSEVVVRSWVFARSFAYRHRKKFGSQHGQCFEWLAREALVRRAARQPRLIDIRICPPDDTSGPGNCAA